MTKLNWQILFRYCKKEYSEFKLSLSNVPKPSSIAIKFARGKFEILVNADDDILSPGGFKRLMDLILQKKRQS